MLVLRADRWLTHLFKTVFFFKLTEMETLYNGHIHAFPPPPGGNLSASSALSTATWGAQGGLVALGVVLGSSVSLVGLAFAFITYR